MSLITIFIIVGSVVLGIIVAATMFNLGESNVSWFRRSYDLRYHYLALVIGEYLKLRRNQDRKHAYKTLIKKYDDKCFPFQSVKSASKKNKCFLSQLFKSRSVKREEALGFIERVIKNEALIDKYANLSKIGKEDFESLLDELKSEDPKSQAKQKLQNILTDSSEKSVEGAMIWLPKLMTPPFIAKGDNNESKTHNFFAVYQNLIRKPKIIDASYSDFHECLKVLKILNPQMDFPSNYSNSGRYANAGDIDLRETINKWIIEANEITAKQG